MGKADTFRSWLFVLFVSCGVVVGGSGNGIGLLASLFGVAFRLLDLWCTCGDIQHTLLCNGWMVILMNRSMMHEVQKRMLNKHMNMLHKTKAMTEVVIKEAGSSQQVITTTHKADDQEL
ncbi:hypothetical protein M513_01931 [Trichuris suis]|uniref:Transmembrane protein n=1 Tax=Trichuris suis TaxID=68888 RepID=A0A085MIK0_9BILA|nr:hypothetical protein M513_01931 [Trichuris suis]